MLRDPLIFHMNNRLQFTDLEIIVSLLIRCGDNR